jgi:hypothetical protein
LIARFVGCTLMLLALGLPAQAEDPAILQFEDPAGVYSFSYPEYYKVNHEFADGTGDAVGVRAEMASKDGTATEESTIAVYSMEPRTVTAVTDENFDAYIEQFKKDFEPNPKLKFVSAAKTQMLDQLGADMLFEQKTWGDKIYHLRLIATVKNGKDIFVNCVYSPGYDEEFSYHCQFVGESLRM